ncbi:uncharacterized protein LOC117178886 [Belonocnema kinseyi]|uniref:uncharacterized protein LOC117178886 n=1 Tax=Belonocnema kinseyi TaxID=2817044 RepID=UPI00143DF75E|nr:uncharacterized protein LOC117178886 [Belonocnema kinseyi]
MVCPSRVADSLHGPGVPVFRAIEASAEELPGVYYYDELNPVSGNQPVLTHLNVVARGNTIIGWNAHNYVRPIYDESGHLAKMEIENHHVIRISIEEAVQLGVFNCTSKWDKNVASS